MSFGSLPAFYTGTRNCLSLHVNTALPGHKIARIQVRICDEQVLDAQFPFATAPTLHPVTILWDSTHFEHDTVVHYNADVSFWKPDETKVDVSQSSGFRNVYNRSAVYVDPDFMPVYSDGAMAAFAFDAANHEPSAFVEFLFTKAQYLTDGVTGGDPSRYHHPIRVATAIHTMIHGLPGEMVPTPGGSITASDVTQAVGYGQPSQKPAVNFAMVTACHAFSSPTFALAWLSGQEVQTARAALGYARVVSAGRAEQFSSLLYTYLLQGKSVEESAKAAFDGVSWLEGIDPEEGEDLPSRNSWTTSSSKATRMRSCGACISGRTRARASSPGFASSSDDSGWRTT